MGKIGVYDKIVIEKQKTENVDTIFVQYI